MGLSGTPMIRWGEIVEFFYLTTPGIEFLKKHRLLEGAMNALKKGIHNAKRDIEGFILTYWARRKGRLQRETIKALWKNVFNNPYEVMKIAIGNNVPYAPYVYAMVGVNWTNPKTVEIEGNFIQSTIMEARARLRVHITSELDNAGYGWMLGRGKLPKVLEVYTSRGNIKEIPRYRGGERILQWIR